MAKKGSRRRSSKRKRSSSSYCKRGPKGNCTPKRKGAIYPCKRISAKRKGTKYTQCRKSARKTSKKHNGKIVYKGPKGGEFVRGKGGRKQYI